MWKTSRFVYLQPLVILALCSCAASEPTGLVRTIDEFNAADWFAAGVYGVGFVAPLFPADDLAALPDGWRLLAAGRVTVPGLEAARHAVLLSGPERDGAP